VSDSAEGTTILLCSAGRRPYLVRWFQEALERNGVPGRVVVADSDPYSPAAAAADAFVCSPRLADPGYEEWLRALLQRLDVTLALSVNDFELSTWSELDPAPEALMVLGRAQQCLVEDKAATAAAATAAGISTPRTWLGSEFLDGSAGAPEGRFVIKSRCGSGSLGLRFAEDHDVPGAILAASVQVLDRRGEHISRAEEAAEHIVVQELVEGIEFGVDVLADFDRRYVGSLARRKLAMRNGETERAETADPTPFRDMGRMLCELTGHRGVIDTDVIVDPEGRPWLIDVNPRFGGGYPFSHMAGAHAPAAVVAWALGHAVDPRWLRADPEVVSAKSIEIVRTGAGHAAE
jgi:carbamoyl-phosphate synthase large subunit